MDLSALTEEQVYEIKVKDLTLFFTLRNPSSKEDLEYRRRSTKVSARNGKIESSDVALEAPLWLMDQICSKVECMNGGPEREQLSKEQINQMIPTRTKLRVITQHLAQLEGEEAETVRD
jgi:hypothetical protein